MKIKTITILAISAATMLGLVTTPSAAKNTSKDANDYYDWCLGAAKRAGIDINGRIKICTDKMNAKYPPQKSSERAKPQQRLTFKPSRNTRSNKPRARSRRIKTSRY